MKRGTGGHKENHSPNIFFVYVYFILTRESICVSDVIVRNNRVFLVFTRPVKCTLSICENEFNIIN
jgi:hypothetical protein